MLETSHCCQFAARMSSSNVAGLGIYSMSFFHRSSVSACLVYPSVVSGMSGSFDHGITFCRG